MLFNLKYELTVFVAKVYRDSQKLKKAWLWTLIS